MTSLPPVPDRVLTGRFEPAQARRYVHIPFDVPDGVDQVHLEIDYNLRASSSLGAPGNTLDVGLFDARGTRAGGAGFRGWSGSERVSITIGREWATPPYLKGPIPPGTWNILLGPYKVVPQGLDYAVRLWFNPGLTPEAAASAPADRPPWGPVPAVAEAGWLRGELHCHSVFSDGDAQPDELLVAARDAGLDFLAVTDHNGWGQFEAATGGRELPVLVPGTEVTTYGGHWNVWGLTRWFDFREPTGAAVDAQMRAAAAQGGLVSVNHPKPMGLGWEYPEARSYHCVEVWNGPWEHLNSFSLAWWEDDLRRGRRIVAVGGSDTHRLRGARQEGIRARWLGQPTTWVDAGPEPSWPKIVDAIRRGRCFISESPTGPELYLRQGAGTVDVRVVGGQGQILAFIGASGCVAAEAVNERDQGVSIPFPAGSPYVRAQLEDAVGRVTALTNPLWIAQGQV